MTLLTRRNARRRCASPPDVLQRLDFLLACATRSTPVDREATRPDHVNTPQPGGARLKVALYARVAASDPGGRRLAEQIEMLRSFARAEAHRVVGEYADDGCPGTTLDRPGLQALREAASAGEFEAVLLTDPYRLTRDLEDHVRLVGELAAEGVRVLLAADV